MSEVQAAGVRFHVQRIGSGPEVVVFLHGLIMDNLSSFYYTLAPPVSRFAEVVLYDIRGHGRTERPTSGYGLQNLAEDHTSLLNQLRIERRVWLVGHSFGGLLAASLAVTNPRQVAGLVLLDPISPIDGWQQRMATTLELRGEERDRRIAASFTNWLGRQSQRKSSRLARNAEALVSGTTLVEDLRNSRGFSREEITRISCPSCIVVGEGSDVRTETDILAALIPGATKHVVPGCTHSLLWEQGAEVQRLITTWLSARMGRN